ncbi:MAG TPA: hypothetical protein VME18_06335 [Acidobacteriaceae bacterium]|nr:hypothetical protein [Acidobacteriaceae bacterium]
MKFLAWLTEAFITVFGITRPKPGQQRVAQIAIGGFLLGFLLLVASLIAYFAVELHAHPH